MVGRESFDQQSRGANVDEHMGVELIRIEFAEAVPSKAGRVIDQQAHRRRSGSRSEDSVRAACFAQVGDRLDGSLWNIVGFVMNMSNDCPAVIQQSSRDPRPDAFACSRNNCGALDCHSCSLLP